MKKIILLLALFLLASSLFAQGPIVKFYLADGTTKNFNMSDIDTIRFENQSDITSMKIYSKGTLNASFKTKTIDMIRFEIDQSNFELITIYVDSKPRQFALIDIDSICFSAIPSPQIASINPNAGRNGDEITINGNNLGDSQVNGFVSFAGIKATEIIKWSSTQIGLKVPSGAQSGIVSVTTNGEISNEIQFSIIPTILSVKPSSGKVGDTISISGNGFGNTRGTGKVNFSNADTSGEYISWKSDTIVVLISDKAETGKLSVTASGHKSNEVDFTIIPSITKLTPSSARIGDTITIAGTGFGSVQGKSLVSFTGADAITYLSWNKTTIVLKIPAGAETGPVTTTVSLNKSNEIEFNVIPSITSITPNTAKVGDVITINGTGFGKAQSSVFISFTGAAPIEITKWNTTSMPVIVPGDAINGKVIITVSGNKSNGVDFKIIPNILNISPPSAKIGDEVTVSGTGFGSDRDTCTLTFIGVGVTEYSSRNSNSIVFNVPVGADTGAVFVTVSNLKSNTFSFKVIPVILSIIPTSTKAGDQITITGNGFGSSRGSSIVSFSGGVDAGSYPSWSKTSITVVVPIGSETGKLSVTVSGQKSNEVDVAVFPTISSIYPTTANIGDSISITGSGFWGTQNESIISFGGGIATQIYSWSKTNIIVFVPPEAETGKLSITVFGNKSNEVNFTVTYRAVAIGNQAWMSKNLHVTHYRNGDIIPQVTDPTEWSNLTTGAWCYYDNDEYYGPTYGKLYNWFAVHDSRGLAPTGWHVPSDAEWTTLTTYLGGESVAGGKLKEIGTAHWQSPNTGATNSTGFTALPGGSCDYVDGSFINMGLGCNFWSTTPGDRPNVAMNRYIDPFSAILYKFPIDKGNGFSIRCVKD